jgi:hypothetical protein
MQALLFPRHDLPGFCIGIVPPTSEGAGNAGRWLHPQPRLQGKKANEHSHYRFAETIRHSLRDGAFRLLRALPGVSGLIATVALPIIVGKA